MYVYAYIHIYTYICDIYICHGFFFNVNNTCFVEDMWGLIALSFATQCGSARGSREEGGG